MLVTKEQRLLRNTIKIELNRLGIKDNIENEKLLYKYNIENGYKKIELKLIHSHVKVFITILR